MAAKKAPAKNQAGKYRTNSGKVLKGYGAVKKSAKTFGKSNKKVGKLSAKARAKGPMKAARKGKSGGGGRSH
jgi:hypothetical protein